MDAVACLYDRETGWVAAAAEQTSQIRVERVLAIRDQLAKGRYSVADRLDAALDRILEDLLQQ
jgi:anti-sigma28 factor (negative regulator of flagellin synthesis)